MFTVNLTMNRDLFDEGIECTIILTSDNYPTYTLHFSQEMNFWLWFNHVNDLPNTSFDKNKFNCTCDKEQWFRDATEICFNADTFAAQSQNSDVFVYYFETDEEHNSYINKNFTLYYERDRPLMVC